MYCPWGLLSVHFYPEYSAYDNMVNRLILGCSVLVGYLIYRRTELPLWLIHWLLLPVALAPTIQVAYFSHLSGFSTYYAMGGLILTGVATAIFTSITVASVFVFSGTLLQLAIMLKTGFARDSIILLLGHLTLHLLILMTLVIRLKAMNNTVEQSERYRHKLDMAKALSRATVHTAHDLKSPLSALTILSESPKGLEASAELFKQAVESVTVLTNNLMNIGKQVIKDPDEKIDLKTANSILNFVSQLLKFGYAGKIEFSPCQGERSINVSSEELERITSNLLKNSIEACPVDGLISIRSALEPETLSIEIADNGPGIDPRRLDSILSRGFSSSKKDGAGVGLQSVQYLVRSRGGSFAYENRSPSGASFKIALPLV